MKTTIFRAALIAASIASLAACGGGEEPDAECPAPETYGPIRFATTVYAPNLIHVSTDPDGVRWYVCP